MKAEKMKKSKRKISKCILTVLLAAVLSFGSGMQAQAIEFTTTDAPAILETTGQMGIYAEPDPSQSPVAIVDAGVPVLVTGVTSNGWFRVDVGGVFYMQGIALAQPGTIQAELSAQPEQQEAQPEPISYIPPQRMERMNITLQSREEISDLIKQAAGAHVSQISVTSKISAYNALWSAACGIIDQRICTYEEATINGCSIHSYGNRNYELEFSHLSTIEEEQAVDKMVAQIAVQFNTGSTYDKILAVHDYICEHVEYSYETRDKVPGYDYRSAYDALTSGQTVCTGYALLFQKFMDMMGIPCFVAYGNNHAWNIVNIDGNWYHIDCTNDDGANGITRYLFLVGSQTAGYTTWGGLKISDSDYQPN